MISVLISCLFVRLDGVINVIRDQQQNVEYIIVVQGGEEEDLASYIDSNFWTHRQDIKIIFDSNFGVAYSRNLAIKNARGEIALFSDDDVTLDSSFFDLLLKSFSDFKNCDFLTFNVEDYDGKLLKPPLCHGYHNLRSILGVGTIQIAIRLNSQTRSYKFPLDLGAGAKYPCCDEPVYLSNFLKNGNLGRHIGKTICKHPKESSGGSLDTRNKIISRLIAFRYIFGDKFGYFIFAVFICKNFKKVFFQRK
ncbi:glycosyltransferase family A protein [Shewanella sp. CAL98-MNA-CIBAN-0140]|uniref:glycosyltransferase family A protein n=1 Tax=Shewanella sp. CAL98-MNA-CIBAN-0140 TaxID=3140462 RepID=UPI0033179243